jgi:hypothetical protein
VDKPVSEVKVSEIKSVQIISRNRQVLLLSQEVRVTLERCSRQSLLKYLH